MLITTPPLRVAMLSSHRAPGLAAVLDDPARETAYDVVGLISSEETFADAALCDAAGIPVVHWPIRRFHAGHGCPLSDRETRELFDKETALLLRWWEADIIFCCSYLYLVTTPILRGWPGAVFSIHHSDMLDRTAQGRVRYPGLRAVRDAIFAGEAETRSCVHLVTEDLDQGPVICRSPAFPVSPMVADARRWGAASVLKAYAFAHQEWMLQSAWGPLMVQTLAQLASQPRPFASFEAIGEAICA